MSDEELWARYYAALLANPRTSTRDDTERAAGAADQALRYHRKRYPALQKTSGERQ